VPVARTLRCALALALCLLAAACSSGSKEHAKPGVIEQHAVRTPLALHVVAADEVGPSKAKAPLDEGNRTLALRTLQQTFDATLVRPVTKGTAGSIAEIFSPDAAARATGPDRAVLFDEGLPPVRTLVATSTDVRLTALDGGSGPALIVAKINWDVHSADGKVRIQRIGELSLAPIFGTWVLDAYTLVSTRTVGGATTTTTAVSR
jgi:hypothetical protein